MGLVAANREGYALLKDGVKVSVPNREHGGQKIARVRVIDWENVLPRSSKEDSLQTLSTLVIRPILEIQLRMAAGQ